MAFLSPRGRETWLAWILLAPVSGLLILFVIYPAAHSFFLSLHEVEPFSGRTFYVGIDNYWGLVTSSDYWQSLRVSLVFCFYTVVPSIFLSLGIAVLLDSRPFFHGFFRTLFLAPVAISSAMAAMLWSYLYNPSAGYLNATLDRFGVQGPAWLTDPAWALVAVSLSTIWRELGFNIIFFLAGLASLPPELNEAAHLDGANAWQRFWYVTLPLLSPTLFFVTTVSVINSLQSFGQIHLLTRGGPFGETTTLVYNLYRDAFVNFRIGYASAQATFLFGVIGVVTTLQFYFARKKIHYG